MTNVRCSNEVAHRLGEIAIRWGNLELFVSATVWQLLAAGDKMIEHMAQAITAEMSFDRKVNAFFSLYKIRFPKEADDPELKALVIALFGAEEKRNQLLHSAWAVSKDGGISGRMKSSARANRGHGLRNRFNSADAATITAAAKEIVEVGQRFGKFSMEKIQQRLSPAVAG
jgi:hypothetical protein